MELMPHLKLPDNLGIRYAILPGDPARVNRIAEQLEDVEELAYNREYKSIAGTYKGVRVLAVSTGIGGPSTGIAVEELCVRKECLLICFGWILLGDCLIPLTEMAVVALNGAIRSKIRKPCLIVAMRKM